MPSQSHVTPWGFLQSGRHRLVFASSCCPVSPDFRNQHLITALPAPSMGTVDMGRNLGDWAGVGRDHKALLLPHGAKSYRRCGVGVQGAGEQEGGVSAQPGARRGVMGGSPDATFGLGLILSRWGHSPGGRHTISESREGQAHGLFGEQRTFRAGWVRPRCGLLQAVTLLTVKAPHPQNESHTHAPPIPRTRNPRRTS